MHHTKFEGATIYNLVLHAGVISIIATITASPDPHPSRMDATIDLKLQHMKINDQYTDLPIMRQRKWQLRHPEKRRLFVSSSPIPKPGNGRGAKLTGVIGKSRKHKKTLDLNEQVC